MQRGWVERYGGGGRGAVRAVGPFGIERVIWMGKGVLGRVLSEEWVDYPRVSFLIAYLDRFPEEMGELMSFCVCVSMCVWGGMWVVGGWECSRRS